MGANAGSRWRRWDLHVHTPASHVNNYGSNEHAWERFIADLEALPSEFSVIGVNDYLFLDGYRRLRAEKESGRLSNIDCLLPVIELRLNRFGGTGGHLSKVNYHVIFSDEVSVEDIDRQFVQGLSREMRVGTSGESWNAAPTRESLTELGAMIKKSVPSSQLARFGDDLTEGFNGFTVDLDKVRELLARHVFTDSYLTAIGKTEWADLKWNDHSIPDKKDIINGCDLVFIASETAGAFRKAQMALSEQGVRSTLLDCSDAHSFSSADDKDRIGNSLTWINAEPSFHGLRHATIEYERRVFVGDVPPKLSGVRERPGQHLSAASVASIASKPTDLVGPGFDLELNPGFVAIIGKKGMGKSAVVDILGLLGDSPNSSSFSFLSESRFREPRQNPAKYFEATAEWLGGARVTKQLDESVELGAREQVRYVPQSLLEEICSGAGSGAADRFENELGSVIFSHVPSEERLGATTLEELLSARADGISRRVEALRSEVRGVNQAIAASERVVSSGRLAAASEQLTARRLDLTSHDSVRPNAAVADAGDSGDTSDQIDSLLAERDSIRSALDDRSVAARSLAKKDSDLRSLQETLETFQRHVERVRLEVEVLAAVVGIEPDSVLEVRIDLGPLESAMAEIEAQRSVEPPSSGDVPDPMVRLAEIEDEISLAQDQLDEPRRRREHHRRQIEVWESARSRIVGDADQEGSILFLERVVEELEAVPATLSNQREQRMHLSREIHEQLLRLTGIYQDVHVPVQRFIDEHPLARDQFDLSFDVALEVEGLADRFFAMVDRAVVGSFRGKEEGATVLADLLSATDFDDPDAAAGFASQIHDRLHIDRRSEVDNEPREVATQLRKGFGAEDLYDLVFGFEYLEPRYRLQSAGDSITRLSPGEKGTLLLMFYLLVDRDTMPLLLDQPEENLDNETIKELLVPALREAAERRQIVVVTHNPNLAVVGDADQVIVAGSGDTPFSYVSGAIENPKVNAALVQILEGSWPAFDNRRRKYLRPA